MTPRIIVDAVVEPVTTQDVIDQGRRPAGQELTLITRYIKAARVACENYLNLTISPKTLEVVLPSFAGFDGVIPLGPVQSIVSLKYIDTNGVEQTFSSASYSLDQYSQPNMLRLGYGLTWPSLRTQYDAVKLRYIAGYAFNESPPKPVPPTVVQAMLLTVDHFMENRTAVDIDTLRPLPLGVKYLLDPHRQQIGV